MTRTAWQVLRVAVREKGDIYHFHDAELVWVALLLRALGAPVIYDVHEDLPAQIRSKGWVPRWLSGAVAGVAYVAEKIAGKLLSGIVAATPAIARRFPAAKTILVQNYPVLGELIARGAQPYHERPHRVIYVGGLTEIRGCFEMVRALELLPSTLEPELVLAGTISPAALEQEIRRERGWARVRYVGWQGRHEVARLLGEARAGLVLFHPVPNHVQAQPNKMFEYMAAGIPIVASNFPLWREIVEGAGCGLVVDPLDPAAIAQAIAYLLNHPDEAEAMGLRGQRAVRERYNWDTERAKLLSLYRKLADGTVLGDTGTSGSAGSGRSAPRPPVRQ